MTCFWGELVNVAEDCSDVVIPELLEFQVKYDYDMNRLAVLGVPFGVETMEVSNIQSWYVAGEPGETWSDGMTLEEAYEFALLNTGAAINAFEETVEVLQIDESSVWDATTVEDHADGMNAEDGIYGLCDILIDGTIEVTGFMRYPTSPS